MTQRFKIGDVTIDLSRNQLSVQDQTLNLPPKALAVLALLARNPHKVMSYDDILQAVWQATVVTPNTLQKSITQLRRALSTLGITTELIKTHTKQGYSLEHQVIWLTEQESVSNEEIQGDVPEVAELLDSTTFAQDKSTKQDVNDLTTNQHKEQRGHNKTKHYLALFLGILLAWLFFIYQGTPSSTEEKYFNTITPITATDNKEFGASYSIDGNYIIFHRYEGRLCRNKIIAKNIKTQQEHELTKEWGAYQHHNMSPDGKTLIFVQTQACNSEVGAPTCHNLLSIPFEQALTSPREPELVKACQNTALRKPAWLDNQTLAFMKKQGNRWDLVKYSLASGQSDILYQLPTGNIVDFTYANKHDIFAVISVHQNEQYHIEKLDVSGRLISSNAIQYTDGLPAYMPIFPSLDPVSEQLVFSAGNALYQLGFDGEITRHDLPFDENLWVPKFHPSGKRLLLIKGIYDSDIATVSLNNELSDNTIAPNVMARTTATEEQAKFNPVNNSIAYVSGRSGQMQIWLNDHGQHKQLSNFSSIPRIYGLAWANDGVNLLINSNYQLNLLTPNGDMTPYPLAYPVVRLYDWDSTANKALLLVKIQGARTLVTANLNNNTLAQITNKNVQWAAFDKNNAPVFLDNLNNYWRFDGVENQQLHALQKLGSDRQFVIDQDNLFAVDTEYYLWSYNFANQTLLKLGKMPNNFDYLTDANDSTLLVELVINAKKGVVELSHN